MTQPLLIPLTQGYTAIVDAADASLVRGKWCALRCGRVVYAVRSTPRSAGHQTVLMHRVIMNPPPGVEVDHVNGDGLDNRRANLRYASKRQQQHNARKRAGTSSRHKGVTWDRGRRQWRATITVDGKHRFLGRYPTEEEAHAAYCVAAAQWFGSYARTDGISEGAA